LPQAEEPFLDQTRGDANRIVDVQHFNCRVLRVSTPARPSGSAGPSARAGVK
jgi:hypothetical protein